MKFFAIFALAVVLILSAWIAFRLPSVDALRTYRPPVASEVFSDEYIKIGEFFRERRVFVPLEQIPPMLVKAFVSAEDDQFFRHRGISFTGIFRAMLKNLIAGEVKQGGSTITQQVAKQLLLRTRERSITRKIREAILAFKMERFLTKERILEIYLNEVFLGHQAYGVQAAAQTFFGKDITELTIAEIAMIAGLTKAPSVDNPYSSLGRAKGRQTYVLKRMKEERYITQDEHQAAVTQVIALPKQRDVNLRYAPYFVEHVRRYVAERYGDERLLAGGLQIYTTLRASDAPHAQRALQDGIEELDRHQGYRGPLEQIPSARRATYLDTLNSAKGPSAFDEGSTVRRKAIVTDVRDNDGLVFVNLGHEMGAIPFEDMRWARKPNPERYWESDLIDKPSRALEVGDVVWVTPLRNLDLKLPKIPSGVRPVSLSQEPLVQGALISLSPENGEIRAMVGGYSFEKSEFNRAVQANRQPGSAFKPTIYAAALDHGYTAASILVDAPFSYDDPTTDIKWRPQNFGGKFYGDTIFRDCLVESRNVPTIKIVQDIGIDTVIDYARRFGIYSPLARDLSLALGSSGVTPIELVSSYSVFAGGGRRVTPIAVKKIVDRDGVVMERNALDDVALDVLEQAAVYRQIENRRASAMKAEESGKDPAAPLLDGYAVSPQTSFLMTHLLKQVIRSGTGRRASAINRPAAGKTGTTNDNRDAWFVGFTPELVSGVWLGFDDATPLGPEEVGGHTASPVWLSYMKRATESIPIADFHVPDGILFAQIDSRTGKLATHRTKDMAFEAFREGSEPKEFSDASESKKSQQQFFMRE